MTKEEYEDFVLKYKGCGACFPLYYTLSRAEKMWFTAIQKDVADLEKENVELKEKIIFLLSCENHSEKIAKKREENEYLEELKSQVIQDCKGHNYCTGCSIWNPWEKKCYLCPDEYNNTDKICPRFIKWEMLNRIRDKIDEMFEKEEEIIRNVNIYS